MRHSLVLDRLVEDNLFRTHEEKEVEIGKKLLKIIPTKPKNFLGFKINEILYPLSKEEISEILTKNDLVNGDVENAVSEFVQNSYSIHRHPNERLRFEKLEDRYKNILYQPIITSFGGVI